MTRPDAEPIHLTRRGRPPDGVPTERDRNGCPVERREIDGQAVLIHYDDLPDSDTTVVDGLPVTTVVRTVIDIAPDLHAADLDAMIQYAISGGLITVAENVARIDADDMRRRPGARMVRRSLHRLRLI